MPPKKTAQPNSRMDGCVPAALRSQLIADGLHKMVSLDLGTGFTSIHTAELLVRHQRITNLRRIDPKYFHKYPGNPQHRPELTTEVPTTCAHIPGEKNELKAQHGYEVNAAGDDETGAVIIDTMKEVLYSGSQTRKHKEILKSVALDVPYLVSRYADTQLAAYPELWMLADFIHSLARLVTTCIVAEGFERDLVWVITIPSIWDKTSTKLSTLALDASEFLIGRYILQSEIESAIAGLMHRFPKQSRMKNGDVFFAFDVGKGTSDFSACRQTCGDPTQVEEIMPSDALFAGSSTVLRLWKSYIDDHCKSEAERDLDWFESDLKIQMREFTERMHQYKGLSGKEVDKVYRICGRKIVVTRNQMKSWFDEWMRLTTEFLILQQTKYCTRHVSRPPKKFFLMGGSSNAAVLQGCVKDFLSTPFFRNTELVLLGHCNSATLVAYGAIIRAVTPVMSTRRSHYWVGLSRKELFDEEKHTNVSKADIVMDDVPDANSGEMVKERQVKTIQWWTRPGDKCTLNGPLNQMPSIKMSESFNEEGSVIGQATDYKVPVAGFICETLEQSQLMRNDADDIANGAAGKEGWSYQSTRPRQSMAFEFEIDFSPNKPKALLSASKLVAKKGYYHITWAILAETTGIGIDFWCAVRADGQESRNVDDDEVNLQNVVRVLFADLVDVIQRADIVGELLDPSDLLRHDMDEVEGDESGEEEDDAYSGGQQMDNRAEVEESGENSDDDKATSEEIDGKKDENEVALRIAQSEAVHPGVVASPKNSTRTTVVHNIPTAAPRRGKRAAPEQLQRRTRNSRE